MKVCPQCNTEYEDSYEFCSKDNTTLESVSEENITDETVAETEEFSPEETADTAILAEDSENSETDEEIVSEEEKSSRRRRRTDFG